ncbi:MAG: Hin recombinase [Propionibacteriaceae bacterium]|nr:Hin recombinase [Propionibacteriaceae bacterium]
MAAAKAWGRVGGRRPTLNADQVQAVTLMSVQDKTGTEIARIIGTSRQTIYRHLSSEQTLGLSRRYKTILGG